MDLSEYMSKTMTMMSKQAAWQDYLPQSPREVLLTAGGAGTALLAKMIYDYIQSKKQQDTETFAANLQEQMPYYNMGGVV